MAADTFLLSPAFCSGRRATLLLREGSTLDIAARLRAGTLTLGEAFSFLSGLYFRGKLAYATTFAVAEQRRRAGEVLVITPTRGLLRTETPMTADLLDEFAGVDLHPNDPRYRAPLVRDAEALRDRLPAHTRVVLLGSIASEKYVQVLSAIFGSRLVFPSTFVGRGDMSRGGLLLRAAAASQELEYVPVIGAVRHGTRPPKLARVTPFSRTIRIR
jgi:hypothetical protein